MSERRPSMKRPGVTATGRQWQVIEALQRDGWLIMTVPERQEFEAERDRLAAELAEAKAHMEALRQRTCPCYLYTDPDCPYLSSADPPQVPE